MRSILSISVIVILVSAGALAGRWLVADGSGEAPRLSTFDLESLNGPSRYNPHWPVIVSNPEGPPRIHTGEYDSLGRPITVSCNSCHANLEPNIQRRSPEEPPMEFHQGLAYHHGSMSCLSCHNPHDYNSLRLADGSRISFPDVSQMCAQCHTPQARDWERGAHGGMSGYWDLSRGPRLRKSCIDCHDPHHPAFPPMTPTFKPYDRFLNPPHGASEDDHE